MNESVSERPIKQLLSIPSQIGPVIKGGRRVAGLSQTALAQRLGVSQSRMSAMELDPGSISVKQLLAIFAALRLDLVVQTRQRPGASSPGAGEQWEW